MINVTIDDCIRDWSPIGEDYTISGINDEFSFGEMNSPHSNRAGAYDKEHSLDGEHANWRAGIANRSQGGGSFMMAKAGGGARYS